MITCAAARKHIKRRHQTQPELVRNIVIPKREQSRINGLAVPWLITEDGLQIEMPSSCDFGYITLELPFFESEISVFRAGNRGA